ncbi:hypothetical protein P879_01653, partial [Paragonimus westermani]
NSSVYFTPLFDLSSCCRRKGPCALVGDAYCTQRVSNSMCSKLLNECYCKPGFVAIQEEHNVTCKTLLTDLKCQTDKDCVHFENSVCHPGAGFCTCPGETILAVQEYACREFCICFQHLIFTNVVRNISYYILPITR